MASSTARPAQPLLSAVVPFLNEAANLPRLIAELDRVLTPLDLAWELVLVDDGSRDDGWAVAKRELQRRPSQQATVLSLSRNFGK
jgi:glycosyltransferase involved in cell wall biosynthesis